MIRLSEKRFVDFFRHQPETGMGYFVVTVYLKDGRSFPQTIVDEGYLTSVRHYRTIPFEIGDIDHFVVTHDKWNWRAD